jgi:hypothetical protein
MVSREIVTAWQLLVDGWSHEMRTFRYETNAGIVVGELFCGESADERRECIRAVREVLGDDKPLIVQGHADPLEAIDLVRSGVSYIASDYVQSITMNRLALNWDLGEFDHTAGPSPEAESARKRKLSTGQTGRDKRQRAAGGKAAADDDEKQQDVDDLKAQEAAGATTCFVNLLDRRNELLNKTKLVRGLGRLCAERMACQRLV